MDFDHHHRYFGHHQFHLSLRLHGDCCRRRWSDPCLGAVLDSHCAGKPSVILFNNYFYNQDIPVNIDFHTAFDIFPVQCRWDNREMGPGKLWYRPPGAECLSSPCFSVQRAFRFQIMSAVARVLQLGDLSDTRPVLIFMKLLLEADLRCAGVGQRSCANRLIPRIEAPTV